MCGIAGIVAPDASRFGPEVGAMVASLRHRGPDDAGTRVLDGCVLGHARLAIVDLTTGAQPMTSATAPHTVTFNGEIFGYQELKAGMQDHPFRTTSDTEVLLALYERHGADMAARLPGQFAFGLWDQASRVLFAARDRFGEKPFYYAWGRGGEFLFASEIKAILATGLVTPRLSLDSVAHYLQYLYVHPYRTIYENVHVLPPAHRLTLRDNHLSVERYWSPPPIRPGIEMPEAVDELRRLLDRAVARQLVADVPVGALLSGGLDSSTVVAVASGHARTLMTFSFGFGKSIDELPFAREVAELYRTQHRELQPDETDLGLLLETMQEVYDEPFGDSSNVPTWLLARLARRHVTVALSGDGADELLGGYVNWYRPLARMLATDGASRRPALLDRAAALAARAGAAKSYVRRRQGLDYREQFGTVYNAHRHQNLYFSDEQLRALGLRPADKSPLGPERYRDDALADALRMDVEDYMPGDILVKTDRASMAHGLELRAPFLDRDAAEFCLSLPDALKVTLSADKRILREAYAQSWPPGVRTRTKQGFGAPVEVWLREPSVRSLHERTLGGPDGPLDALIPRDRLAPHIESNTYVAWSLLVLALWLERHPCELPEAVHGVP